MAKHECSVAFRKDVVEQIGPIVGNSASGQIQKDQCLVTYESNRTVLRIRYDPYSFEITVCVQEKRKPHATFTLQDIVDTALGIGHGRECFFQASTIERMHLGIAAIARLLKDVGGDCIAGDVSFFD